MAASNILFHGQHLNSNFLQDPQEQPFQQFIDHEDEDSTSASFAMVNQKLSSMTLAACDFNGNDSSQHQQSNSGLSVNPMYFNAATTSSCFVDDFQQPVPYPNLPTLNQSSSSSNNSGFLTAPTGNEDNLIDQLQSKLRAAKHQQAKNANNYMVVQKEFQSFVHACRQALNVLHQELSDDFESNYKLSMGELTQHIEQLEDVVQRVQRTSTKPMNGHNDQSIEGKVFDPEFVYYVNKLLESDLSEFNCNTFSNVDVFCIDRAMRSTVLPLLNKPQMLGQHPYPGQTYLPPMPYSSGNDGPAILPATGLPTVVSNSGNVDSNKHFVPSFMNDQTQSAVVPPIFNGNGNNWSNGLKHSDSNQNIQSESSSSQSINHRASHQSARNADNSHFYSGQPPSNGMMENNSMTMPYFANYSNGTSNESSLSAHQQKQNLAKSLQPKLRRDRMIYFCKFGEQGTMNGQFAEPSGVAVNPVSGDILIADANNHRIQVFDKYGKFKFHFGEGKLKFPNRVAISRNTGEIIVSERPPVHQIQVYNRDGSFVCKFGAKHLRHPRGLTVDHKNRVVVVECKVMRVFIFDLRGELMHSFDCSQQIQFPNAVVVSRKEEIFISDNRSHCVKVFNFNGDFLRQIGGQGVTNYPIGVCLNETLDQLLVVDNYNNLNVTIFKLDGTMIGALESTAKHQQCLDVAMLNDNSLVVTSKDLQVYIYRLKDCSPVNGNNSGALLPLNPMAMQHLSPHGHHTPTHHHPSPSHRSTPNKRNMWQNSNGNKHNFN